MVKTALLLTLAPSVGAAKVFLSPGAGLQQADYGKLGAAIEEKLGSSSDATQLCVGHSVGGVQPLLNAVAKGETQCDAGIVALGAAPLPDDHKDVSVPMLVVSGDLDGHIPFSHFAAAMHRASDRKDRHFATIRGASHMSFASGTPEQAVADTDLVAELSDSDTISKIADIVGDFVTGGGEHLTAAKDAAAGLAAPVVAALKLEGSTALGQVACNSHYPTNPTCNYPKYPDHSLPFGPSPAPSPPLPSNCICGSPWVMQSGKLAYNLPGPYSSTTNDAFQDVADVHPFHLPHIFNGPNSCYYKDASCILNVTTVTMPVQKAGDIWPSTPASAPLSVFEFKTKFKSREAVRAYVADPTSSSKLDDVNDMCKNINDAALKWALANAEASVKSRYESKGEPLVMVDDVEATIGITGPQWIADEMVYKRVKDSGSPTGTRIEVQSWKFVVGNTLNGSLPWFAPVGMHYCKLLSPARAMEWIYTDSLRSSAAAPVIV